MSSPTYFYIPWVISSRGGGGAGYFFLTGGGGAGDHDGFYIVHGGDIDFYHVCQ